MARIRTIKPEFQNSQSMGRVSRDARLTFIELWPQCDDAGRIRANSRMLASVLFPYDEDAPGLMDGWLNELENEGCITRYSVDKDEYLQINHWDHQKIDHPQPSKLPSPQGKKTKKSKLSVREETTNAREDSSVVRAVSSTVSSTKPVSRNAAAEFDPFWKACPKKVGKGAAEKAFLKAIKSVSPAVLIAAMTRYAISQEGKDETFIVHPATWLNQRRWEDEDTTVVVRPSAFQSPEEIEGQRLARERAYGQTGI